MNVDFTYTPEQIELRALMRKYLASRSPEDTVRRLMETEEGNDRDHWKEASNQLGLQGLIVPEEYGGAGMGSIELGIVLEELGSSLACLPFFSTVVLATSALLGSGNQQMCQTWLPQIVSGDCIATLAVTEDRGVWNLDAVTTSAVEFDGWKLTGRKTFVVDGHSADLILVAAKVDGRISLFAVQAGAAGLTTEAQSTMDQTRKLATVDLDATPAVLVAEEAAPLLARIYDVAIAALSAEQVGGAQRCLDMAVDHARTRFQFGRAIGSFQAIKHKCADLLILIEAARAASAFALWSADCDEEGLPLAASMAKATCSEAFFRAAADNIQIHGGIGFTWEHPAHLYFKRAKSSELWWGDPVEHRERIGRLLALAV